LRSRAPGAPEIWAGVEGTVNRVHDRYHDQLVRNGHVARPEDLERFAALGVRAIRYPVLWEHVAPDGVARADWSFPDERLPRLRALGVRPIVGLVHHGSGPPSTSLVDPEFPERLAAYARAVAERYPWVLEWTPVNEPLTTARFCGLYGHWYPHGRDDRTFVRALLVQMRAIVVAMRAIREVVPGARLVQTEDMGRTTSTPRLAYEAELQNHRRWLSYDLLCGLVGDDHPLRGHLAEHGATDEELAFFREHATPPDVVGLNYYVTSDRWVDHRVECYPEWSRGGRVEPFADLHAPLADPEGGAGHRWILERAWERYRLPVALTEVHIGGAREDQLRWLRDAWRDCVALFDEGVDVRALTVWSLLGAFDWNSLVTVDAGFYEPGPFDVRGRAPRRTALARMTRSLARTGTFDHPVLAGEGWWRRAGRYAPGCPAAREGDGALGEGIPASARPIVIVGGTGTLGRAFARICTVRGLAHRLVSRRDMDIASRASVRALLDRVQPWAVVNAAGYVRVDDAEAEGARCVRENAEGPAILADACAARDTRLVTFSSDLVFDGALDRPYLESDAVAPLSVYGRSKAEAERTVLAGLPSALVVRTSAFFGPWDPYNFVTVALMALARGELFLAAEDALVSPTYVPDLVNTTLDLLIDGTAGIWHLANAGATSWADLARRAAVLAELDPGRVRGVALADLRLTAARPRWSVLASERGSLMPSLESALERYLLERELGEAARAPGGGRAASPSDGTAAAEAAVREDGRGEPREREREPATPA
jgi:dTDP-4-dehydrorhamnose reductase